MVDRPLDMISQRTAGLYRRTLGSSLYGHVSDRKVGIERDINSFLVRRGKMVFCVGLVALCSAALMFLVLSHERRPSIYMIPFSAQESTWVDIW